MWPAGQQHVNTPRAAPRAAQPRSNHRRQPATPSVRGYRRACPAAALAAMLVLTLVTTTARATESEYEAPEQVTELGKIFDDWREEVRNSGSTVPPQDVIDAAIEISSVLTSPCDALRWLIAQIEVLPTTLPDLQPHVFAQTVLTRRSADLWERCPEDLLNRLRELAETPPPPPPPVRLPREPDPAHCHVTVTPQAVVADGKHAATITVIVLDSDDEPLAREEVLLEQVTDAAAKPWIPPQSRTTSDQGRTIFSVSSLRAGAVEWKLTCAGVQLDCPLITFVAAPPSPEQSTVSVATQRGPDGTVATITVELVDAIERPVVASDQDVQVEPVPESDVDISRDPGSTPESGKLVYRVTAGTALPNVAFRVSYIRDTQPPLVLGTTGPVSFEPPPTDVDASQMTASPEPPKVLANGEAAVTITVTLLDAHGNPVRGHTVYLTTPADVLISPKTAITNNDGRAEFRVTSNAAQDATLRATDKSESPPITLTDSIAVTFVAPPVEPPVTPPPQPPPPPPPDETALSDDVDPASLAGRLAEYPTKYDEVPNDPAQYRALCAKVSPDVAGGFKLLARGASPWLVIAASRGWEEDELDYGPPGPFEPRLIIDELTKKATLPSQAKVRGLCKRLIESHSELPAVPHLEHSFIITAALLDRAVGIDRTDLTTTVTDRVPPFNYADYADGQRWGRLADELEADNLWLWSLLARILDEQSTPEQPQQGMDRLRMVSPRAWPALDAAADGWLPRLAAGKTVVPGQMPLTPDFRRAARRRRELCVNRIKSLRSANPSEADLNQIFMLMQVAKVADTIITPNPELFNDDPLSSAYSVSDVAERLGVHGFAPLELKDIPSGRIKTHEIQMLFVEVLRLSADGQPDEYCGVAQACISATPRNWLIRGASNIQDLVDAAIGKKHEDGRLVRPARIIIALDGPLSNDWFTHQRDLLLEPVGDSGCILYLPSAPVMTDSYWTCEQVIQTWYRLALHATDTLGFAAWTLGRDNPGGCRVSDCPVTFARVIPVWSDPLQGSETCDLEYPKLLAKSRAEPGPHVIPLWVSPTKR